MTKKEILRGTVIVVAAASLSGLVAYRLSLRRSPNSIAHPFASAEGAKVSCLDFHDAQSHVGASSCVSGRVVRALTSRAGNAFLDFCPDYRTCPFATVIFASDLAKFGDLGTLTGRQVEIRGRITVYQGRAEIIIHDPEQIRVLP